MRLRDGSKKRLNELSTIQSASVYNQVYHVQKPDYSRDVTDESKKAYVLVLLTSSHDTNTESRVMIEIWRELARRFGDVKFCQMRADLCIEGYPDRNTPTVLAYKDGDIKKQIVTLRELRATRTTAEGESKFLRQCVTAVSSIPKVSTSLWIKWMNPAKYYREAPPAFSVSKSMSCGFSFGPRKQTKVLASRELMPRQIWKRFLLVLVRSQQRTRDCNGRIGRSSRITDTTTHPACARVPQSPATTTKTVTGIENIFPSGQPFRNAPMIARNCSKFR